MSYTFGGQGCPQDKKTGTTSDGRTYTFGGQQMDNVLKLMQEGNWSDARQEFFALYDSQQAFNDFLESLDSNEVFLFAKLSFMIR